MIKVSKIEKKLNIGLHTIANILHKKGYDIEVNNPNLRISDEMEHAIYEEYSLNKKEDSECIQIQEDLLLKLKHNLKNKTMMGKIKVEKYFELGKVYTSLIKVITQEKLSEEELIILSRFLDKLTNSTEFELKVTQAFASIQSDLRKDLINERLKNKESFKLDLEEVYFTLIKVINQDTITEDEKNNLSKFIDKLMNPDEFEMKVNQAFSALQLKYRKKVIDERIKNKESFKLILEDFYAVPIEKNWDLYYKEKLFLDQIDSKIIRRISNDINVAFMIKASRQERTYCL